MSIRTSIFGNSFLVAVALLTLLPPAVPAQEEEYEDDEAAAHRQSADRTYADANEAKVLLKIRMGLHLTSQKRIPEAVEQFQAGVKLCRIPDKTRGLVLRLLGDTYLADENGAKARQTYGLIIDQARDNYESVDKVDLGAALRGLGVIALDADKLDSAQNYLEHALKVFAETEPKDPARRMPWLLEVANLRMQLSKLYTAQNKERKAKKEDALCKRHMMEREYYMQVAQMKAEAQMKKKEDENRASSLSQRGRGIGLEDFSRFSQHQKSFAHE